MTLTEEIARCEECEQVIYRYCHSQAGSLKAYVWTDIDPEGEIDPRWGTRCLAFTAHVPGYTLNLEGDPR